MAMRNSSDSSSTPRPVIGAQARRWTSLKIAAFAVALLGGCAGTQVKPDDPTLQAANLPPGGHDVTCQYGELMAVQGRADTDSDQSSLFAVLTFPEANLPAPKRPMSFGVAVQRSRTDEPQAEADTRPSIICAPETQSHSAPSRTVPPG
jgi:hypothetical protein